MENLGSRFAGSVPTVISIASAGDASAGGALPDNGEFWQPASKHEQATTDVSAQNLLIVSESRYLGQVKHCTLRQFRGGPLVPLLFSLAMLPSLSAKATPKHDTPNPAEVKERPSATVSLSTWARKQRAQVSWSVVNLPDLRSVTESNAAASRNPASVTKLVTAYAALKSLGPSFQYSTTLHGRVVDGAVGRLGMRGEGDPSLSSDVLQIIAARLRASGISRIEEAIVVDQSFFDDQYVPPAFDQQPDEWAAFRAPICATAVDRNRLLVRIIPSRVGGDALAYVEPFGAAELSGHVGIVARDTKASRIELKVVPSGERPSLHISGELGAQESALSLERRTADPSKLAGYAIRMALNAHGIGVPDQVQLGPIEGMPKLYTHQSATLALLLHRLGKDSDNFAAEMLLKTMGARGGVVGSSAEGSRVVTEALARQGLPTSELRLTNGSGLFDANRVTTNFLTRLLGTARADAAIAPEFMAQLSIAGVDGTLSRRFRTIPRGCSIRAKTGTLRSVVSLAGYVDRADGQAVAFAVIAEDVKDQSAARQHIDNFVLSLCAPLAASTPPRMAPM